jgi:hypothetical protein
LVLRNVNSGQFEVYDVAHDRITGASLLGAVGLDWAADVVASNPAAFAGAAGGGGGGGPVADAATTQLTQAMAGFGADSGTASLSTAVQAEPQQQTLLTTPHG